VRLKIEAQVLLQCVCQQQVGIALLGELARL